MATATKKEYQQFDVVLTLSKEEAQTLLDITRQIGGSPLVSRRKYSDSIGNALSTINELDNYNYFSSPKDIGKGYICFYDSPLVQA